MAELTVIYWRDIPSQVVAAKSRREQVKAVLDERFEQAIDRAAMKGKASGTDDYLAQWHKVNLGECDDDLATVAAAKKSVLEAEYNSARLDALVANGGREAE